MIREEKSPISLTENILELTARKDRSCESRGSDRLSIPSDAFPESLELGWFIEKKNCLSMRHLFQEDRPLDIHTSPCEKIRIDSEGIVDIAIAQGRFSGCEEEVRLRFLQNDEKSDRMISDTLSFLL